MCARLLTLEFRCKHKSGEPCSVCLSAVAFCLQERIMRITYHLIRLKILFVMLLFISFTGLASVDGKSKKLDEYIKREMTKHQIPGLALAVVKNGKVIKLKGYGLSSLEFDLPANENTVFQLYSVSKIFAGVAIMKLVEEGKLSLDTPVTKIIANLPPSWKGIRIRHLLTHTSGL